MYACIGGATMGAQNTPASGVTIAELRGASARTVATTAVDAVNPMYLATSPDGRTIYAAHAVDDGYLTAWSFDGIRLSPLGPRRSSGGGFPCHVTVHPSGRYVLTANYAPGTVAVHPIETDGALADASHVMRHQGNGPDQERQDAPLPHMVTVDPGAGPGRGHLLAVDLGTDTAYRYRLDLATGILTEADHVTLPPGTEPRHLAVHGRYAYAVGELASTLTVVDLGSAPPRVPTTVATHVTRGAEPSFPSAIRVPADGHHAYVLNRGPNTIAAFAVNGADVALTATVDAGGDYPWDASIDDDHLYVVSQRSDMLSTFRLAPRLRHPRAHRYGAGRGQPVCIHPVPGSASRCSVARSSVRRG